MEWTSTTPSGRMSKGYLGPLLWRRERVAFLHNRQAKVTVNHPYVQGGGPIDEVCL